MLTPETIRAYQRRRVYRMIARSIVGAPRQSMEEEKDDTLEQRYYEIWPDEIGKRDLLGGVK